MLFYILFQTMYGPERPLIEQIRADLETIWNSEGLTVDVFENNDFLRALFDKYSEKHRANAWWLEGWGVSRREALRAGFFSAPHRSARRALRGDAESIVK